VIEQAPPVRSSAAWSHRAWYATAAALLVEEGYAIGRPSRIRVQVSGERVGIGGPSVVVAEGTLTV
jgi:predicted PhzF superfamily epimerase YddE/YHI9